MLERFEGFADSTGRFFKQLAKHQDRDWFKTHRGEYDEGWHAPMLALVTELKASVDAAYPDAELAEAKVFRIYRDVRFSKNKAPFKTQVSGTLGVAGGEDAPVALYLQLGSENLAAAGAYQLSPPALARLRERIVDPERGAALGRILAKLNRKGFSVLAMESLKRVPRGFDPEHPRAELLKMKGLGVRFPDLPPKLLPSRALLPWLVRHARDSAPLVRWLAYNAV